MLSLNQINAQIRSIKSKNVKLREQIHVVAVSIIGHTHAHGDATVATRLIDAMGRGLDRQALVTYFEDLGCVKWDKNTAQFKINKSKREEMVFDEEFLNSEACARWYDYARSKKELNSAFDIETRVNSLLKQIDTIQEEGKREVRNVELADYLRTALIKYHLEMEIGGNDTLKLAA